MERIFEGYSGQRAADIIWGNDNELLALINQLRTDMGAIGGGILPTPEIGATLPAPENAGFIIILQGGVYPMASGGDFTAPDNAFNVAYWTGATWELALSEEVTVDMSDYVAKADLSVGGLLVGATLENGSVSSGGAYLNTVGAVRVRFLELPAGDYVLDGPEASAIKFFSFRSAADANVGDTLNLGTLPLRFTIPSSGVAGISFTIKAPDELNDDSITNASLLGGESDGSGVTLTYNGKRIISDGLTSGNYVPPPTADNSAVGRKWVQDNAMSYYDGTMAGQSDISATIPRDWDWQINEGAAVVNDISGVWGAVIFTGATDGIGFTVRHVRLWIVIGYSSPTQLCCVGVAGGGNLFGQVVNVDLSTDTFTVVRSGAVTALPVGQSGRVELQGDTLVMYKGNVVAETVDLSTLAAPNLGVINFGLAGASFSGSISNGSTLASSVTILSKVPLTSKIAQLDASTPNIGGQKLFILGDSISTSSYGGLVDGQIWWQLVRDALGLVASANAVSGTPIAEKSGFNSFVTDARWQAADLDTDIYIIEGGINDFGAREVPLGVFGSTAKTDFFGAMRYLFAGVAARYPRAKIFYMTPLHTHNYGFPAVNPTTSNALQEYVDAARQMCDMVGVTVIDTYQRSGITYQNMNPADGIFTTDGLHPNAAGHVRMAEVVTRTLV